MQKLFRQLMNQVPESVGTSAMTLTELKVETLNNQAGKLDTLNCPICKNKGYIAIVSGDSISCRECECMPKRRSLKRIEQSGLSELLSTYTFSTYETAEKWQQTAKHKALDYTANGMGQWFVITGTPGTGKTHLCTAVCKKLIDAGREVRYMLWREEAPRLKANVNDRERYDSAINELKNTDVLYVDDFFKGGVTEADINLAFEILNARYNSRSKMTLISSEKTVEQVLDIDEAIGSRIAERSRGYCMKTPVKNWRLK